VIILQIYHILAWHTSAIISAWISQQTFAYHDFHTITAFFIILSYYFDKCKKKYGSAEAVPVFYLSFLFLLQYEQFPLQEPHPLFLFLIIAITDTTNATPSIARIIILGVFI
jgi:hypothetical protein